MVRQVAEAVVRHEAVGEGRVVEAGLVRVVVAGLVSHAAAWLVVG